MQNMYRLLFFGRAGRHVKVEELGEACYKQRYNQSKYPRLDNVLRAVRVKVERLSSLSSRRACSVRRCSAVCGIRRKG